MKLDSMRFVKLSLPVVWMLMTALPMQAVEIGEPQWGFDGRVRLDRFNLLTIPLDNPSPVTETFFLELRKSMNGPVDAPVVQSITMSPGQRRIVQLYPYVSADYNTSWSVRCDRKQLTIDQPRSVRRGARVLLESSDVVGDTGGSLRRFPAGQFPPFVAATDALEAVVIDHVPNWDEPRRTAFLDWLYKGGAVYVLQTANGKYPDFAGPLAMLNSPLERVNYGSGVVQRVAMTRRDLTRTAVKQLWTQLPNRTAPPVDPNLELGLAKDDDDEEDGKKPYGYADGGNAARSQSFLETLTKMTKPEHNWLLLHSMFWVYILLIFPGCFLVGQQRNDFRIVYAALAATVVVFSLAFGIVGRRGYGEETTVNAVAIVQPLPNGTLDVAQWSNAFVKSGAIYTIKHHGAGTLYSTCQDDEAVRKWIENGNQAVFEVDIPPFSSRAFAHRMKVAGTLPPVTVADYSRGDSGLSKLTLSVDASFPQTDEMYLLYGNRFYSVSRRGNEIHQRSSIGTVPAFLRLDQNQNYYPGMGMGMYGNDGETSEDLYRSMVSTLITRSLNLRTQTDAEAVRWSPGRVRLMYVAPLLPELALDNPRFKKQSGKALYCVDLELTEKMP